MAQRRRTLVNHTSDTSTWDDAFLYWALPDHNKQSKYWGLGLGATPLSFQRVNAVCSISPFFFMLFHHALLQSRRPPQQNVRQGNVIVVSFDALQPKYAVLFFKTLSIRLNEARASCLYLAGGDVLQRSYTFLTYLTRPHSFTLDVSVWESETSVWISVSLVMRCRMRQIKEGNEHHPSPECWKRLSRKHILSLEHIIIRLAESQGKFYTRQWILRAVKSN